MENYCYSDLSRFANCVAVIASREQPEELFATISSVVGSVEEPIIIDVLINGNAVLASATANIITQSDFSDGTTAIRVWSLPLGDKANTWNQYLHLIWPGSGLAFFVDGYSRLSPNALRLLKEGLLSSPTALAGSSVPTTGRSATKWREAVLKEGGLVGCFFAFKKSVMLELRERKFNLPLGLYGYDATLGAVIAFGLDPSKNEWRPKERIFVHPKVTWFVKQKNWWRYTDVKVHINRSMKAALRVLVGQALRDFFEVRKLPPEQLPRTTEELVLNWATNDPLGVRKTLWRAPLSFLALQKLREPKDWSAAEKLPTLVYSNNALRFQTQLHQTS